MIAIIEGRSIKKPARLRLGDDLSQREPSGCEREVLTREIGFDYRSFVRQTCNTVTANDILDYVAYRGPIHAVIVTLDSTKHGVLLHASISRKDADPTWADIKAMKAVVFGDIDVMMVLPKQAFFVNAHDHCFHLWQMPTEWGIG